jgi:hypothetical protein
MLCNFLSGTASKEYQQRLRIAPLFWGGNKAMTEHEHSPRCKHLLASISDYVDGELKAELCVELEQHLQKCDNCRMVVDTLRKTIELYQHSPVPADLPGAVRERLFYKLQLEDYLTKA